MLFAQYMCCSPSMEVQIEETETETATPKVSTGMAGAEFGVG